MLRVCSWNIALGTRLATVLDGLAGLPRLDLVALQEASEHGWPDAAAVAQTLGPGYRCQQVTAQLLNGRPQANALVWDATRFEATATHVLALPTPLGRMLKRLPPSRRSALVVEGRFEGMMVRIHVVHLDVLGIAHKHAQLRTVLEDAAGRPPPGLALIAGDLNTIGGQRVSWPRLRALARGAGFEELTAGCGWTHRAFGVRQKLDAVFASPSGIPHRAWVERLPGSDHLPLLVEVAAL